MKPFKTFCLLLSGLLAFAHLALAQMPDEETIRRAHQDRISLEQTIAELLSRQEPHSVLLIESWQQLGTILLTLEDHTGAAEAFNNAWQGWRIGHGLEDLGQLPILERLLDARFALQEWEQVDALHHVRVQIAQRNPEADPALRVESLLQLAQWNMFAEREALVDSINIGALNADKLFRNEIRHIDALPAYEDRNLHLAALYLGKADNELLQAKKKLDLPISAFGLEGRPSESQLQCFDVRGPTGQPMRVCQNIEVPNINYYLQPGLRKNKEIWQHMEYMKSDVMDAWNTLQLEMNAIDRRNTLLEEVQRLTGEYNSFFTQNNRKR